jgi:exonuclease SbcC
MVPVELELKNFLSYKRQQTIDFRELELAVLAGENGHGKSALLDAITWALFGEARKPSGSRKPDDNLLNRSARGSSGATEMHVRFAFESEGAWYEVLRSYRETASGKTTTSDLEFRSQSKNFTAGSQRETQEIIEEVVGTDYSTFINTSFLLQGRSDEFTQKSPAERKAILTQILQLGRFSKYRSEVGRRKRQAQTRLDEISGQAQSLKSGLEGREDRKEQLEVAKIRRDKIREETQDLEETLDEFKEELEEKEAALGRQSELREELERLQAKRESKEKRRQKLEEKLAGYEEILAEREEIRAAAEELDSTEEEIEAIEGARDRYQELESKFQSVQSTLESKRESFQSQKETLKARIQSAEEDLEYALGGEVLSDPEAWFEDALQQEEAREERREELEEKLTSLKETKSELGHKGKTLRTAISDLGEDIQELEEEIAAIEDERCPTCGQVIPEEKIEEHTAEFQEKKEALEDQKSSKMAELYELQERKNKVKAEIESVQSELSGLEEGLDAGKLREELQQIRNAKENRQRAREELERSKQAFAEQEEKLTGKLHAIADESDGLSFDAEKLESLKEKRSELKPKAGRIYELRTAENEKEGLEKQISHLSEDLKEIAESLEELSEKLEGAETPTDQEISDLREKIANLEETAETKDQELSEALGEIGRLEEKVSSDERSAEELRELKAEKAELKKKKEVLSSLFDAFGKHGIPSLIIEGVIPSIEERANRLLGRLSEQSMQVRLETLKEKSSGGQKDTLDIVITDDTGVRRPYETFSGGERFRINFALRVALSQTLASRSGAPLRTLVIDEGFGTQDEAAISRVKSAIGEVASDFEKVLVITHLRELKGAFPQKIEVTKEPGRGSTFTVHS